MFQMIILQNAVIFHKSIKCTYFIYNGHYFAQFIVVPHWSHLKILLYIRNLFFYDNGLINTH